MTPWQSNIPQNVRNTHFGIDCLLFIQFRASFALICRVLNTQIPLLSLFFLVKIRFREMLDRYQPRAYCQWSLLPNSTLECWPMSIQYPNYCLSRQASDIVPIHCGSVSPVTKLPWLSWLRPHIWQIRWSSLSGWPSRGPDVGQGQCLWASWQ